MAMKIFSDMHHGGLYASFKYLFEDRLGHQLYRPIDLDWFDAGYWHAARPYGNNPDTVNQYLGLGAIPKDKTPPLNTPSSVVEDGVHYIRDVAHGFYHKAISLETFKKMEFDVVIASIPDHIEPYMDLIKSYMPKAKLVYHVGNIGWHDHIPWKLVKNTMLSVKPFPIPNNRNAVFYRQEFELDDFMPTDTYSMEITSFVNCLPEAHKFHELASLLPEYKFQSFGVTCRDGIKHSVSEIASTMSSARFGYHNKPGGDGFGHVIHNWFAIGKPIIVNMYDYRDKLAGELLEDMKTCINIENRSMQEVANIIKNMSDEQYDEMCMEVKNTFYHKVDFEKDAEKVKMFLENLI